jgi:hypothetical protein
MGITSISQANAEVPAGLRLITPTSIASSGGSSSASGGEVTFTGVSSISLNGVFTSASANYRVVVDYSISASNTFLMRLRASGSDDTSASYNSQQNYAQASVAATQQVASSSWQLHSAIGSGASMNVLDVVAPNLSANTRLVFMGYVPTASATWGSGNFGATTQFDGFTIYPGAGTITGIVRVYAYENN